jgi:hypothetical protein
LNLRYDRCLPDWWTENEPGLVLEGVATGKWRKLAVCPLPLACADTEQDRSFKAKKDRKMNPDKIIVKFEDVAEQQHGPVKRLTGFVMARHMLTLFDAADLTANPRQPKAGEITASIIDSIRTTPETFPFKTKGVLISSSSYTPLDRKRFELEFVNTRIEGILDGGHNMLAIGTHILAEATQDERLYKKIKYWPDFKDAWAQHRQAVDALKKAGSDPDDPRTLDFQVPLEILVPSDTDDEDVISQYNSSLLDICAARNNNAELKEEAKANKLGLYEDLRKALPKNIADRVEWKTNEGGDVKVRDLIPLAWIPLSVLDLPFIPKMAPRMIYSSKGACVEAFNDLMAHDEVSKPQGDYQRELHNTKIGSALKIAGQLPGLFDKIYLMFPDAYNDAQGKFGKIRAVRMARDYKNTKPTAHFTDELVDYSYPDGFIMPLIYGLKALLGLDANGYVVWKHDPSAFLDTHLETIVQKYKVLLEGVSFDPQKIGKSDGYYGLVTDMFETELLRLNQAS